MPYSDLHLLQHLEHLRIESIAASSRHIVHLLGQSGIERLSDLLGLADTTAFDDDVVELLELRKANELLEEVAAKGAANAPILHRDDLLVGLCEGVCLLDQGCVDIDTWTRESISCCQSVQCGLLTLQCR